MIGECGQQGVAGEIWPKDLWEVRGPAARPGVWPRACYRGSAALCVQPALLEALGGAWWWGHVARAAQACKQQLKCQVGAVSTLVGRPCREQDCQAAASQGGLG